MNWVFDKTKKRSKGSPMQDDKTLKTLITHTCRPRSEFSKRTVPMSSISHRSSCPKRHHRSQRAACTTHIKSDRSLLSRLTRNRPPLHLSASVDSHPASDTPTNRYSATARFLFIGQFENITIGSKKDSPNLPPISTNGHCSRTSCVRGLNPHERLLRIRS